MSTYTLISSQVLGSSAASVTFSSIPQTYTDLKLALSVRTDYSGYTDGWQMVLNSNSTGIYSATTVYGNGSSATSQSFPNESGVGNGGYIINPSSLDTANTFSSCELYIPNYTSTASKQINVFNASEGNYAASHVQVFGSANLIRLSSAITSMTFTSNNAANFIANSTFYLYGLKNA